jgi:2,3-bisphosphoglycerate-independent phosphoglycerate mutase
MKKRKTGLIILDGWGIGQQASNNAIYNANTPVVDGLLENYPNARLKACGEAVGLPEGQMGNSEVGHLNIGAGRIVYQELTRINKSIASGEFFQNAQLVNALENAKSRNKNVHFFGLVSDGGVHSSQEHLHALCDLAKEKGVEKVFIHAFTDGRDCDPKSGKRFLAQLEKHIAGSSIQIKSIIGRYFAMDRDQRWERVRQAYNLLVKGEGKTFASLTELFNTHYGSDVTDEFIPPSLLPTKGGNIEEGDVVISFNFRTDRPREIVLALSQKAFPDYGMVPLAIDLYTMTPYDETFKNVKVLFEKDNLNKTLGEVLATANKTQIRIAETEKYPHVTFFFNGGREAPFARETRILVNSPKVATYDMQPEMSAYEVTDEIVNALRSEAPDFFCLNYANPDMVGHTGVYSAIVNAVEVVDNCLGKVIDQAKASEYELIIIADHGNADFAVNDDGSPNTAHSLNEVPVILFSERENARIKNGILADVAPTILDLMELEQPEEMTGKSLMKSLN